MKTAERAALVVREASENDATCWDSFVNDHGGSFFHYFDWREIYALRGFRYIPLMLEDASGSLLGILPLVVEQGKLYTSLVSLPEGASGGIVLRRDLPTEERTPAVKALLAYAAEHYAQACSTFRIKANLAEEHDGSQVHQGLVESGFSPVFGEDSQLPCTHILTLDQPFEERIWRDLWSQKVRKSIGKIRDLGVEIVHDTTLAYADIFTEMLAHTYQRHGNQPPTRDEVEMRLTRFAGRSDLFIALLGERAVGGLLCYYTPTTCYLSKLPSYADERTGYNNILLEYHGIKHACDAGYRYVEFGITDTMPLLHWKNRFKGTVIPLSVYERKFSSVRACLRYTASISADLWQNRSNLKNMVQYNVRRLSARTKE
ncbi:MAG: GNAT family N-acetyltransferase [Methanobacteriota archaeon]|nr:MAG: GNAT family N-acetyltransferase [Euryarchaeota archaeon]